MRTAAEWFERYGESHRDPVNKAIHWICIPVILTTTLGLLAALPHPFGEQPWLHWGSVVAALALIFYARLSSTLAVGMALVSLCALSINHLIVVAGLPLALSSALAFVAAWVLQFIGHKIEGRKPSFLEDLQFLLIGPAWLLHFVYARVGIPVVRRHEAS